MRKAQPPSPTKEKLLEAAQRLMQSKGFAATTVDEICEAAGVSKGSFFRYFKSKEQLGETLVERYCDSMYQLIQDGPFRKNRDPLQRVYGYVDFVIKMTKEPLLAHGCLLGNFTQELSDTHPEIRALCTHRFALWAEAFKQDLHEAKAQYAPKASVDTQSLAEHFIAIFEGSLVLAKAQQNEGTVEKNLRHFKRYLKSLLEG